MEQMTKYQGYPHGAGCRKVRRIGWLWGFFSYLGFLPCGVIATSDDAMQKILQHRKAVENEAKRNKAMRNVRDWRIIIAKRKDSQ